MSEIPRRRRLAGDRILAGLGFVAALGIAGWVGWMAWQAWFPPRVTYRLRITGGRLPGPKQRLAEVLAREAADLGVRLSPVSSSGSVESLDMVNDGRVDVAVVQGGLDSRHWGDVRQVAALHVEPLQLAVRGDLALEVGGDLRALKGRTINIGEPESGSNALAREVLAFAGLRAAEGGSPGDYTARTLGHRQLEEIGTREGLPDAVITISSLPTPVIRHLVTRWGYRLVPLPFGEAFSLEDLHADEGPARVDPPADRAVVDKVHLQETHIPAYTYGVEPAVPFEPMETFGSRALVVAHRRVDPEAVKRLLQAVFFTEFVQVARPPLDVSLLDRPAEFPLHPGTVEFLERNKPLIVGDAVDLLEKSSSLATAILGGSFVVWQWAKRRYRRRRELGFESYLFKVTAIEAEALRFELAAHLDLAALLELQADLGRIKTEAIRRFTQGELEGEGLMSGFLTHANDARDYLARLILHARTAIEKRARKQGLSPDAAWALATGGSEHPPAEDEGSDGDDGRPLPSEGLVL